jgi:hypothetical protein
VAVGITDCTLLRAETTSRPKSLPPGPTEEKSILVVAFFPSSFFRSRLRFPLLFRYISEISASLFYTSFRSNFAVYCIALSNFKSTPISWRCSTYAVRCSSALLLLRTF